MKKIVYSVVAATALLAPVAALAQFAVPANTNLPQGTVLDIVTNIMKWLLIVVGILAVIAFVIAGILYLTSAGNEDRISSAKKAMVYAIIGVVVALVGLVVIVAVQSLLGGQSTSF